MPRDLPVTGFSTSKILRLPTRVALCAAWMAEAACKVICSPSIKGKRIYFENRCVCITQPTPSFTEELLKHADAALSSREKHARPIV